MSYTSPLTERNNRSRKNGSSHGRFAATNKELTASSRSACAVSENRASAPGYRWNTDRRYRAGTAASFCPSRRNCSDKWVKLLRHHIILQCLPLYTAPAGDIAGGQDQPALPLNTLGQMIRSAIPVSSSMLTNSTPRAEPRRWRTARSGHRHPPSIADIGQIGARRSCRARAKSSRRKPPDAVAATGRCCDRPPPLFHRRRAHLGQPPPRVPGPGLLTTPQPSPTSRPPGKITGQDRWKKMCHQVHRDFHRSLLAAGGGGVDLGERVAWRPDTGRGAGPRGV